MPPLELKGTLESGLLSFPVTHFNADRSLNLDSQQRHVAWLSGFGASALFAAGGTGEFFSLRRPEISRVTIAVKEAAGNTPIISGCGYGTEMAKEIARDAEASGADGLLLFPQYLIEATQDGLFRHIKSVCDTTDLAVILYNRGNCVVDAETLIKLADQCQNLIGFKDGTGDIGLVREITARLGNRLCYIGGMPTHELFAHAYWGAGVTTYSSAVFNFVPKLAVEFYNGIRTGDHVKTGRILDRFFFPFAKIRDRRPGYAVSIIKAGCSFVGHPAGPSRPPLTDLSVEELEMLRPLVERFL